MFLPKLAIEFERQHKWYATMIMPVHNSQIDTFCWVIDSEWDISSFDYKLPD